MAEEGGFGDKDPLMQDTDDRKDDDVGDTTGVFEPVGSSTPGPQGQQIEMQTMQHEQSGLPQRSYIETSFGGRNASVEEIERRLAALRNPTTGLLNTSRVGLYEQLLSDEEKNREIERVKDFIKKRYPKVDFSKLVIKFSSKKFMDIVAIGPRGGETKIALDDGSGFRSEFLEKTCVKNAVGPTAASLLEKENVKIRESRQASRKAQKEAQMSEKIYSELVEAKQKEKDLLTKIERTKVKKEQLGSNVEELKRLQQLEKNYLTDLENNKKEVAALEKQVKDKEKKQTRIDRLRADLTAEVEKRNTMEERLNSTKTLDEINEQEAELQRQNEEDRAIIDDENTSPSEREAAEGRVAERQEELARLRTQIEERERAMPLSERVKEIFKKYGVTVTAIVLAAGVTIGAVIGAITNALKSMGKALGNGLKDIGKKTASLLPGLIGQIVSFLFKAAGQAIGFLAEHTWLLILAVVAFLVEGYIKKQR